MPHRRSTMVRRVALLLLASAASLMSCGPDFTGPSGGRLRAGALAINPLFPRASQVSGSLDIVPFVDVRIILRRSDESLALDTVVAFPANVDEISLSFSIPISKDAPATGELLSLTMQYRNAAGDIVFIAGPVSVTLLPFVPGSPPPIVDVPATYTGTGSNAVSVTISPTSLTTSPNTPLTFTAQALDANSAVIAGTPLYFTTNDATIVDVTLAGVASVKNKRGTATITAHSLTGQSADALITVQLPASALAAISGSGQSALPGTQLAQPVVVRATASDGVGVAGVTVTFAAANGGNVGAPSVITDASGNAQTTWTLGAGIGAQSLTASASGLTGSPVTFTASASTPSATHLTFSTQPQSGVAGFIAGPVTVTARDAGGNVATAFNGTITLGLGQSPGGATIGGTFSAAAVSGVATFATAVLGTAGTYTLTAQAAGLTSATSNTFTISPAATFQAVFVVQPTDATAGTPIAPAIQVAVQDAFGNTITSFTDPVTLFFTVNPTSATLTGTATVNAVAGIATFPTVGVSTAGTGYRLGASVPGLSTTPSVPFNVTAGTGATVNAWINAAGGVWSTPSNWSLGRVPITSDSVVINAVGNYTVTMDVNVNAGFITLGGVTGTQTLSITGRTLNVSGALTVRTGEVLELAATTVNGPGVLANSGLLIVHGTVVLTGGFTTVPASVILVEGEGGLGNATLTVTSGFTNNGLLELTSAGGGWGAALNGGTVINAPGSGFGSEVGSGGGRSVGADVVNQGSMVVLAPTSFTGSLTNSGSLDVNGGDLVLSLVQAGQHFTNTGTVNIGATRTLAVQNGNFTLNGGSISGTGRLTLTSVFATFATSFSNAQTALEISNSSVVGPGSITNAVGRSMTIRQSTLLANVPLINNGTLITHGNTVFGNVFTAAAGSTLRIEGEGGLGGSTLTISSGFTNNGTIELTSTASSWSATLNGASVTNAPGATISSLVGASGARTIGLALVNNGTVTIDQPLTLSFANALHVNAGTINVNADFTLAQSGGSFTNTGTVAIASGGTWSINGGVLNQNGGAIGGVGTLSLNSMQANFATSFTNSVTALQLSSTTVSGPGTITNTAGRTLTLRQSTFNNNAPLNNQGTLVVHGTSSIHGVLTTSPSSVLRIEGESGLGPATLTVTDGFTNNNSTVELTSTGSTWAATLNGGQVSNAIGASIVSLAGAGGPRTIGAVLSNSGTLTVNQPLTLALTDAQHINTGTINANADLTISQAGGAASFANFGTIAIASARTVFVNGGAFNQNAGSINGPGTLSFESVTATFQTNVSNALVGLVVRFSTIDGPTTVTNATGQTLTLYQSTLTANTQLVNQGTLLVHGTSSVIGGFTTGIGSTIRVEGENNLGPATFTVTGGFINNSLVELTSSGSTWSATLNGGTVNNLAGSTIRSAGGTGGPRSIGATLVNTGLLTVDHPLTLALVDAQHANAGTITIGADFVVSQTGTVPSFTNAGNVSIAAGSTWNITGGTLNQNSGLIGGAGALSLNSVDANFATPFTNAVTALTLSNTTVNGAGLLTNATGRTLTLDASTIETAPLVNDGLLVIHGVSAINGTVATGANSVIRIEGENTRGPATLNIGNIGLANSGTIEMTSTGSTWSATLNAPAGPVFNDAAGKINVLPGSGGPRTIGAQIANLGTINVDAPLSLAFTDADHANIGTLNVTGGDLFVQQTGLNAIFTNSGTLAIAAGRTVTILGGSFVEDIGGISGAGTLDLNGVQVTFSLGFSNATTGLLLKNTTVDGIGAVTNEPGKTLTLDASSVGALTNFGTVIAHGNSTTAAYVSEPGSTLVVEGENARGSAALTIENGFANFGAIVLTSTGSSWASSLTVGGDIGVQAGASLVALAGSGGTRTVNGAILEPGDVTVSPGAASTLNVNATTLVMAGKLTVDLGGKVLGQYDQVAVGGTAVLGGTLTVNLINSFAPALGDEFTIMTCSVVCTGVFLGSNLPPPPNGTIWELDTLSDPKAVRLRVILG